MQLVLNAAIWVMQVKALVGCHYTRPCRHGIMIPDGRYGTNVWAFYSGLHELPHTVRRMRTGVLKSPAICNLIQPSTASTAL